jgi:hypothetical protein
MSNYDGLRCPHCAGKLPGYVSRDAELARIREETQKDAEVVRLSNQLAGVVEALTAAVAHEHGWRTKARGTLKAMGVEPPPAGGQQADV